MEIRTFSVSLEGLNHKWKIEKPGDIISSNGQSYIRIACANWSLQQLVCENSDLAPKSIKISSSKGLASLIAMRNKAQAASLAESDDANKCSLFDNPTPQKKPRVIHSRGQVDAFRKDPQSLELDIDINGEMYQVSVLRPIHPTDNLFVAYDADMLATVLHHIRSLGFEEHVGRERLSNIPRGIHKRKDGYVVQYVKPEDGKIHYKSVRDIDEALEQHALLNHGDDEPNAYDVQQQSDDEA